MFSISSPAPEGSTIVACSCCAQPATIRGKPTAPIRPCASPTAARAPRSKRPIGWVRLWSRRWSPAGTSTLLSLPLKLTREPQIKAARRQPLYKVVAVKRDVVDEVDSIGQVVDRELDRIVLKGIEGRGIQSVLPGYPRRLIVAIGADHR